MKKEKGFTLIELLVVIIIIGILASFVVPAVMGAIAQAKVAQCKNNAYQLFLLANDYKTRFGGINYEWPTGTGATFIQAMYNAYSAAGEPTKVTEVWICPIAGGTVQNYLGPNPSIGPKLTDAHPENTIVIRDNNQNHGGNKGVIVTKAKRTTELTGTAWTTALTSPTAP